jgi:hypothetical protein
MTAPKLAERTIDELTIEDEASFRHVGLYSDLKAVVTRERVRFRVLPDGPSARWDRALLLNLTFWGASEGGDVLVDERIPADVVSHVAWHHLAARALSAGPGKPLSVDALFLGEAIASAFDVYLVGRLLGHSPASEFLATQVPALADSASAAGMDEEEFDVLLQGVAADPDRAFEDLRELLFDATTALVVASGVEEGFAALSRHDDHRFAALLHHYELSNWVLYARAYGASGAASSDARARDVDRRLREAPVALDWLTAEWIEGRASA